MEQILDHYKHPRNFGTLKEPDISHEEGNPSCGDLIRVDLALDGDGERIVDVKFSGKGCAISQAAASMLTERIKGCTLEEVKSLSKEEMLEMLGIELSPMRVKCALLALKVVKVGAYGVDGWPDEDEG